MASCYQTLAILVITLFCHFTEEFFNYILLRFMSSIFPAESKISSFQVALFDIFEVYCLTNNLI